MRTPWLAWLGLLAAILCYSQAGAEAKPFTVFDGTLYVKKPDLRNAGLEPLYVAYESHLFREQERAKRVDSMPAPEKLDAQAAAARSAGSRFLVIDIELWSVYGSRKNPKAIAESIARYRESVLLAKKHAPDLLVGLFSPLPVHAGYDRLIAPVGSEAHADMVADNDNLFGLAAAVDAIFPIGYTVTSDRDEWLFAIQKQVSEARRLRKDAPLYVFLWPQYTDYRPTPKELQQTWLPTDYWRFQLEKIYELADGVVIWGGWDLEKNRRSNWDEDAPWWQTTREFMRDKHLVRPKPPVLDR